MYSSKDPTKILPLYSISLCGLHLSILTQRRSVSYKIRRIKWRMIFNRCGRGLQKIIITSFSSHSLPPLFSAKLEITVDFAQLRLAISYKKRFPISINHYPSYKKILQHKWMCHQHFNPKNCENHKIFLLSQRRQFTNTRIRSIYIQFRQ